MTLRNWLVRLYPSAWRERYGEEFGALLQECLHGPLDVLDILLGALDAHLGSSAAANWRSMNMNNKLRTAILTGLRWVHRVCGCRDVAGYGFADDSPFIPVMRTNLALHAAWTTSRSGFRRGVGRRCDRRRAPGLDHRPPGADFAPEGPAAAAGSGLFFPGAGTVLPGHGSICPSTPEF